MYFSGPSNESPYAKIVFLDPLMRILMPKPFYLGRHTPQRGKFHACEVAYVPRVVCAHCRARAQFSARSDRLGDLYEFGIRILMRVSRKKRGWHKDSH